MSETELDALEHLEHEGPLTQRELGDRLSLTSGAITMLIDRLEAAGWAIRGPHPTDRRYVLVELNPALQSEMPHDLVMFHARIRSLANSVPVEHREALCEFLDAAAGVATEAAEAMARLDVAH
jgi:DNA-binding MarR family transcriptional regulator